MSDVAKMKEAAFPAPTVEEWEREAEKSLKGKPLERLVSMTYENIAVKPLYTRRDVEALGPLEQYPGFGQYVRGARPEGYRGGPWKVSQEISAASPSEWNEAVKHDLERGQTEIHFALGRLPFAVESVDDVAAMLDGVLLDRYSLRVDAGARSLSFLALLVAYFKEQGVPLSSVRGAIGMDPLGAWAEQGTLPCSLERLYDEMAEATKWAKEQMPAVRTILVRGEPYHNGGANAVQELAFSLATAVEYIRAGLDRGLAVDDIAVRMQASFAVGADFFMEIAKLRAARRLFAQVMEAFGGGESAKRIELYVRTSPFTKTVYDPYVNMLRAAAEAFAAVVGGADGVHVSPFDEAIGLADEFSRRIARNTQLILLEEAHVANVIDPAGGSYYVETLTAKLAEEAWKLFQRVEEQGGMAKALEAGFVQTEVEAVAKRRLDRVKMRKEKIVGTNVYANLEETPVEKPKQDAANVAPPLDEKRVADIRASLAGGKWMEAAIRAVRRRATAREIAAALADGNTSIRIAPIRAWRLAEPFERLRKAAEKHAERTGSRLSVHLINIGPLVRHQARADFIAGLFAAGGVAAERSDGFASVAEAVEWVQSTNGTHYIVCGADDDYPAFVPALAEAFKQAKPNAKLYVAGKPPEELERTYADAGVDGSIHLGSNAYDVIVAFLTERGVALDGEVR
ncbi:MULTISPECIES: methylmalonyl-CoA mutase family protein [unclassified Geobacillus]|uniref:methylmalonyl-CoA mutase family protein n=1 Tax=unclassified Geobacillus TaxID=2642459 RepID=UPI000C2821AB|nr:MULTISPECIES: methylmalonyl-CoA mutase family protein [unclassified Geobacillus]PJW15425.1 methylmalonyl-CoA mutase [Geobacillus sp. Manikaran-105]PJW18503.1 methylmalonyl-CoA mutase [Geobacillus sp. WSUCF-018B]